MANKDTLSLMHDHLFGVGDNNLTPNQERQLKMYQAAFSVWLDKPWLSQKDIVNFLMKQYSVSRSKAYIDVKNIQTLLGNVKSTSKEWYRHVANEMIANAYSDLEDVFTAPEGENKQADTFLQKNQISSAKTKILAARVLVDINRLNKIDADTFDWDKIKVQTFEPTDDPSYAGLKSKTREDINQTKQKLYKKYGSDIEIEDINFESVDNE